MPKQTSFDRQGYATKESEGFVISRSAGVNHIVYVHKILKEENTCRALGIFKRVYIL